MPAFTGYFTPGEDQAQPAPAPRRVARRVAHRHDPHRPANLPSYAAQGTDGYGNPSERFHQRAGWRDTLACRSSGVSSARQGDRSDAQTQQNRRMYVSRANMMTRDDREQLNNMADPHHTLDESCVTFMAWSRHTDGSCREATSITPTRSASCAPVRCGERQRLPRGSRQAVLRRRPSRRGEGDQRRRRRGADSPGFHAELVKVPMVQW